MSAFCHEPAKRIPFPALPGMIACDPATKASAEKSLPGVDKIPEQRRLDMKDPQAVMENVATDEDWKVCFAEAAPGLVLFARQFVRSIADAEDIVQEAFVRFWRKQHSIRNRALLFATVRSISLDLLRRDVRRARREADAFADAEQSTPAPQFDSDERKSTSARSRDRSIAGGAARSPGHENLERTHFCRHRGGPRDLAEHRGIALSLRARRFEKERHR